ncbi:sigma-70 family RNA polymerase sigma factor [Leptolyngbya sp. FACHB-261]|uniref:sigma-70 family RNA polymerase sigma factor n=1 Tax=Leptolyngbya sp. FACHB-261 TaxID=2692806 RepID=UPI001688B4E7|nr:sigma-70 family RNA polymerase sigma factor [Leptolyngbya sp. FACHB-261]MBD2100967.1 sigma-70 family RNA polymerase sigma factor [Leptolyngbya sp. FACHB-261]
MNLPIEQGKPHQAFDIRDHLEALENLKVRGRSWEATCPVCGGNSLKGATTSGKYKCWSGGCTSRDIRERIAPRQGELSWQDRLDRERQRRDREQQAAEARSKLLHENERHGQYQALQSQLGLSTPHRQELLRRGLNLEVIERLGYRSLMPGRKVAGVSAALAGIDQRGERLVGSRGILLWCYDPTGRILGGQIKTDSGSPKYLWWSSEKGGGNGPQLPNGELPLACQIPNQPVLGIVGLCEGMLKSAIAAELSGQIFIGASGGHFGFETLRSYLEQLQERPGFEQLRLVFYPDAGAVNNTGSIPGNTYKLFRYLQAWGYEVSVAWWGQERKEAHLDIDELLVAGRGEEIEEISPQAFFELHPLATRQRLEPFRPHRTGLRQVEFPVPLPYPAAAARPPLEYQRGQRLAAWRAVSRSHRLVLDTSGVGLGKSYEAGLLDPALFGCEQAIYVTLDPRNVSTPTLREWPVLQGRHGGLMSVPVEGTLQLRRAQAGDEDLVVPPNCDRWQLAELLPARNRPATGDEICKSCSFQKSCRTGSGPINYLQQRRQVTVEPRYIAHPESLSPDDFLGKTLLILDEASRHPWLRSFLVKLPDLERTAADLLQTHPQQAALLAPLFAALRAALQLELPLHGLAHDQVLAHLPPLPELSLEQIEELSHQGLEFLNLAPDGETELSDLPGRLQQLFRPSAQQLSTQAEEQIALRWLPEFWQAVQGNGRLQLNTNGLQITARNQRFLNLLQHPDVTCIFLDATAPAAEFEAWLGAPVAHLQQALPTQIAQVSIQHVTGLGLLGSRRGNEQQRRTEAVLDAIRARHPHARVGVIDGKNFSRAGDGLWHRDSRGSNAHQHCNVLVLVGAPIANVSALSDEYALMQGRHPASGSSLRTYPMTATNLDPGGPWWVADLMESADPGLAQFIRQRTLAEIEQAIGRLRANCRPGERLTVYWLSDYPLNQPVELLRAGDLSPEAKSKPELSRERVVQAIAQLKERGEKLTQQVIAQLVGLTQGAVSKILRSLNLQRLEQWSDTIPSALDLSSDTRNKSEPPSQTIAAQAVEPLSPQLRLHLAQRLLQCRTRQEQELLQQKTPTPHLKQVFELLTPEQQTWVQQVSEKGSEPPSATAFDLQEVVGLRQRPGERGKVLRFYPQTASYQVQVGCSQEVLRAWDLLKVLPGAVVQTPALATAPLLPERGNPALAALCAALQQCETPGQLQELVSSYSSESLEQAIQQLSPERQERLGELLALGVRNKPAEAGLGVSTWR